MPLYKTEKTTVTTSSGRWGKTAKKHQASELGTRRVLGPRGGRGSPPRPGHLSQDKQPERGLVCAPRTPHPAFLWEARAASHRGSDDLETPGPAAPRLSDRNQPRPPLRLLLIWGFSACPAEVFCASRSQVGSPASEMTRGSPRARVSHQRPGCSQLPNPHQSGGRRLWTRRRAFSCPGRQGTELGLSGHVESGWNPARGGGRWDPGCGPGSEASETLQGGSAGLSGGRTEPSGCCCPRGNRSPFPGAPLAWTEKCCDL